LERLSLVSITREGGGKPDKIICTISTDLKPQIIQILISCRTPQDLPETEQKIERLLGFDRIDDALRHLSGRIVLLGGAAKSGKTTMSIYLKSVIERKTGKKVVVLRLDRYFKQKSERPLREDGRRDLDNPQSLHVDWLQDDLKAILSNETVALPTFWDSLDRPDGVSQRHSGESVSFGDDTILIIESIFALHEMVLSAIGDRKCLKVFVDSSQDLRLIRRILHEEERRDSRAIDVIRAWALMKDAEDRFVLPQKTKADFVIDSYAPGYLSAIKEEFERYLSDAEAEARASSDAYVLETARRLRDFIRQDSIEKMVGRLREDVKRLPASDILDKATVEVSPRIRELFLKYPSGTALIETIEGQSFTDDELIEIGHVIFELESASEHKRQEVSWYYNDLAGAYTQVLEKRFVQLLKKKDSLDLPKIASMVRWLLKFNGHAVTAGRREVADSLIEAFMICDSKPLRYQVTSLLRRYLPAKDNITMLLPSGRRIDFPFSAGWKAPVRGEVLRFFGSWAALSLYYRTTILKQSGVSIICDTKRYEELLVNIEECLRAKDLIQPGGVTLEIKHVDGRVKKGSRVFSVRSFNPGNFREAFLEKWEAAREKGLIPWDPSTGQVQEMRYGGYPIRKEYYPVRGPRKYHWRQQECIFCSLDLPALRENNVDLLEQYGLPLGLFMNGFPYFPNHWLALDYLHDGSAMTDERLEDLFLMEGLLGFDFYISEEGASHDEHYHPHAVGRDLEIPGAIEERWGVGTAPDVCAFRAFPGASFIFRNRSLAGLHLSVEKMRQVLKEMGLGMSMALYRGDPFKAVVFPRTAKTSSKTGIQIGTNELIGHFLLNERLFASVTLADIIETYKDVVPSKQAGREIYWRWLEKVVSRDKRAKLFREKIGSDEITRMSLFKHWQLFMDMRVRGVPDEESRRLLEKLIGREIPVNDNRLADILGFWDFLYDAVAGADPALLDYVDHYVLWNKPASELFRKEESDIIVASYDEPITHNYVDGRIVETNKFSAAVPHSLHNVLTDISSNIGQGGASWVAIGSGDADFDPSLVTSNNELTVSSRGGEYLLKRVKANKEDYEKFRRFSNELLWPLLHMTDETAPEYRELITTPPLACWESYKTVNAAMAQEIAHKVKGSHNPLLQIHDYELFLTGGLVRKEVPGATTLFFLHIAWPKPAYFSILPDAIRRDILQGLLGNDVVAFHTDTFADNFINCVRKEFGRDVTILGREISFMGRRISIEVAPLGIDFGEVVMKSRFSDRKVMKSIKKLKEHIGYQPRMRICLSVERADYIKGTYQRLEAIEALLEAHPELIGKIRFVQIVAPVREYLKSYRDICERIRTKTDAINRKFGNVHGYLPIYTFPGADFATVTALFRSADMIWVNSLIDGLNLVSKEYVASRALDDRSGIVILSKFAGAAEELKSAVLINPFDKNGTAEHLFQAYMMSGREQRERFDLMYQAVSDNDLGRWSERLIKKMIEVRRDKEGRGYAGEKGSRALSGYLGDEKGLLFMPRRVFEFGRPVDTDLINAKRSAEEVMALMKRAKSHGIKLSIKVPLRAFDGPGSTLDNPPFYKRLTPSVATYLQQLPSTPTVASDRAMTIRFELADDEDVIEYIASDYNIAEEKPYTVKGGIPLLNREGTSPKERDAPALIFQNLFGLRGIRIICEDIPPLALMGGMEASSVFNVALVTVASILSGADLSVSEISNLTVKLECDELRQNSGWQGAMAGILGGAYHHIMLDGIKNEEGRYRYPCAVYSLPFLSDENCQTIEEDTALVQAGIMFKKGEPVNQRTSTLINNMWTDMLLEDDEAAVALLSRTVDLATRYIWGMRTAHMDVVAETMNQYVDIRDELCRRWAKSVIEGGREDLLKRLEAEDKETIAFYGLTDREKAIVKEKMSEGGTTDLYYYALKNLARMHADSISLYSDTSKQFIEAARREGIAVMPMGAGGPGAMLIAISPAGKDHLTSFFRKQGMKELTDEKIKKGMDGTGLIRGYLPLRIGKESMRLNGFTELGLSLPGGAEMVSHKDQEKRLFSRKGVPFSAAGHERERASDAKRYPEETSASRSAAAADRAQGDDAKFAKILLFDLLGTIQEGKSYEIKYDTSRISPSQAEIVEEYVKQLQAISSNPGNIRLRPFSSAQGSKESLIAVYCTGKDFKGEGHVDVAIHDGELKDYLLRIAGMVNIALASSNIPDNLSREDIHKYRPIMSYIKNQYKLILDEELAIPGSPKDILKVIRRIVLDLPKSMRTNLQQIEEYNRLAKEALTAV